MNKIYIKKDSIKSEKLLREVVYEIAYPSQFQENLANLPVLYMNDGQDLPALNMVQIMQNMINHKEIPAFVLVAIHANERRIQEYGTAKIPDYKNRGALAEVYSKFVLDELMPKLQTQYHLSKDAKKNHFCGFSLGGLSAIDLVWNNPKVFSKVGVFSGSFWWRKKAYEDGYDDHNDRIMHNIVRSGNYAENLKFWFECGTNDEKDDRNNNGIIDAIEDTLDLITELKEKGYKNEGQVVYFEVKDGEHNQKTWSEAMPSFLKWLLN